MYFRITSLINSYTIHRLDIYVLSISNLLYSAPVRSGVLQ